jgi:hypothetical protein
MAMKVRETGTDHHGNELPDGVSATTRKADGVIVGYRIRWWEEDHNGIRHQPSRSFSERKLGSLDRALEAAITFLTEAREAVKVDGSVARVEKACAMTPNDLLREWIVNHGPEVSQEYREKSDKFWAKEIEPRPIGRTRLDRISSDPSVLVRFQDELVADGIKPSKRREILRLFRAVMRWGRRRHPNALTVELSGLIQLPKQNKSRLAYAADAIGLERIIEAVLTRPARDDLLPLRDAALVAAMGYTIASRPSEWRLSAAWENLFAPPDPSAGIGTVELQRASLGDPEVIPGLKTGAHVALVLPNAWDRIAVYREALEDRFGPQPQNGLVFQVLGNEGPVWVTPEDGNEPVPLAWTKNNYNQWVRRVWNPARTAAAQAPDAPAGLNKITFYDCRHTAISMALHSTLVVGPHGMNLHPLAGWAAHDIETLQRYYRHLIARYLGQPPIDIEDECRWARLRVEQNPFKPDEREGPQREAQRRRRARAAEERERQTRRHGAQEPERRPAVPA